MGITLPKMVIDGSLKIILRGAIKVLGAGFGNSRPPKIFSSGRCNLHNETTLHCLRDCPESMVLWKAMGFTTADIEILAFEIVLSRWYSG
ncbi:hypothetical protein Lal_00006623 [Lupinus albus]|nr:hypothetical protein Lal_00006623 [Lupinus albus]